MLKWRSVPQASPKTREVHSEMTIVYIRYSGAVGFVERKEDIRFYVNPSREYRVNRDTFRTLMRKLDSGKIRVLPWMHIDHIVVTIDFDAPGLERDFAKHIFYKLFTPLPPNQERIWPGDRKVVTIKPPVYDDDLETPRLFPKREVVRRILEGWLRRTATSIDFTLGFFDREVKNPWWF